MARGEGYVGFVIAVVRPGLAVGADRAAAGQGDRRPRPCPDRDQPDAGHGHLHRLTVELGVGYARTADVLDYKLAGGERRAEISTASSAWTAKPRPSSRRAMRFGVRAAGRRGDRRHRRLVQASCRSGPAVSLVPIIGHFECRDACMARDARPAGAAPAMTCRPVPRFYRRNVGLMLIAPDRRIFVGRRASSPMPGRCRKAASTTARRPVEAACRELWEEVGTTRRCCCARARAGSPTTCRRTLRPAHWKGRWHGQAQKWFALAFTGQRLRHRHRRPRPASSTPGNGCRRADMLDRIVPFKRPVYEAVLKEFADLVTPLSVALTRSCAA